MADDQYDITQIDLSSEGKSLYYSMQETEIDSFLQTKLEATKWNLGLTRITGVNVMKNQNTANPGGVTTGNTNLQNSNAGSYNYKIDESVNTNNNSNYQSIWDRQKNNWKPVEPSAQIAALIQEKAAKYGLDPKLFESLIQLESNYDTNSVSSAGAVGLGQLMPGTAKGLGVTDRTNPEQNLEGSAKLLSYLIKKYNGDLILALSAYNAGEGSVARAGNSVPNNLETQLYYRRILYLYQQR